MAVFQGDFYNLYDPCSNADDKDISAMRGQILYLKQTYGANIELLRAPLVEVSSTTIRKRASDGLTVRFMVPDNVADYIREQKLYREEDR